MMYFDCPGCGFGAFTLRYLPGGRAYRCAMCCWPTEGAGYCTSSSERMSATQSTVDVVPVGGVALSEKPKLVLSDAAMMVIVDIAAPPVGVPAERVGAVAEVNAPVQVVVDAVPRSKSPHAGSQEAHTPPAVPP